MINAGLCFELQEKYEQAEPLFLQARSIWEKVLGPDHPDVAYVLNDFANFYLERGMYMQQIVEKKLIWKNEPFQWQCMHERL